MHLSKKWTHIAEVRSNPLLIRKIRNELVRSTFLISTAILPAIIRLTSSPFAVRASAEIDNATFSV
jgi:hypothetical protein